MFWDKISTLYDLFEKIYNTNIYKYVKKNRRSGSKVY